MPKQKSPQQKSRAERRMPDELIHPHHFYRRCDARKFFGYASSVLDLKIKAGEIPVPVALSDSGRATGWFGQTILDWQQQRKPITTAKAAKQSA